MHHKFLLTLLAIFTALLTFSPMALAEESTNTAGKDVRILFTSDLHSNILPYKTTDESGKVVEVGGYARLKTLIDQNKTAASVLVDAGDFSMGSLFNSIFSSHSAELVLMGQMGYDATTIGNHEFDFGVEGLKKALITASAAPNHPTILNSNMVFGEDDTSQSVEEAFQKYGSLNTKIITRDGVKIGVFGLLSAKAQSSANDFSPITFADTKERAKACVAELKNQGADVIVCLSHGGTDADYSQSEDQQLAKAVSGIDVIISGHTHTTTQEAVMEGSTIIASGGWRGENLGVIDLTLNGDGGVSLKNYALKPSDVSVAQDKDMTASIATFKEAVQAEYLTPMGLTFDGVVATSNKTFSDFDAILSAFGNYDIGDLVTDALVYQAKAVGKDVTIGVVNAGIIRDTVFKGTITQSDVYDIFALGKGSDGSAGEPMVDFYLYGAEIKTVCQLDPVISTMMSDAQFSFSGLRYTYNAIRLPLDKVVGVEVQDAQGNWVPLESDQLYHVVSASYVVNMANLATDLTHGLVTIAPRDKDGQVVKDTADLITKDAQGHEVKEWVALSTYFQSFPKNAQDVSVIPASYDTPRDTKMAVDPSLFNFFSQPSKYAIMAYSAVGGVILLIVIIVLVVRHHRKKKRSGLNAKL